MQQREKAWFASSPKSRLQYLGPNPGLPSLDEKPSQEFSLDPSARPVDAFCLLVLDPEQVRNIFYPVLLSLASYLLTCLIYRVCLVYVQVDYLNLKINERLTFTSKWSTDGQKIWTSEGINPWILFCDIAILIQE